jgi:hypothetical protein
VEHGAVVERTRGSAGGVLGAVILGALSQPDEVGHGLGGMIAEECDLDVAAVGVQGRGRCLNGARHDNESAIRVSTPGFAPARILLSRRRAPFHPREVES